MIHHKSPPPDDIPVDHGTPRVSRLGPSHEHPAASGIQDTNWGWPSGQTHPAHVQGEKSRLKMALGKSVKGEVRCKYAVWLAEVFYEVRNVSAG